MANLNLVTYLYHAMQSFTGGEEAVAGLGQTWRVTYSGSAPQVGDTISIKLMDGEAVVQTNVGAGDASSIEPTYCRTYGTKVMALAGTKVLMSAVDAPTSFNNPEGIGNGYVTLTNQGNSPEDIVAMAPFQGRLAFFGKETTLIFNVPTDPAGWSLVQSLDTVGTIAKESVQAIGHLDVLFLDTSGIRSIKARQDSLNAYVDDVGSPINETIRAALASATEAEIAAACGVVEPNTKRYWLFLKDKIYVLSYFPSSKVTAWSTYLPVDSSGSTFAPTRFHVHKKQVYAHQGNKLYQYGGDSKTQKDNNHCVVELPWMDLGTPGNAKAIEGIRSVFSGTWSFRLGDNPARGITSYPEVLSGPNPYLQEGNISTTPANGTHFKLRLVSGGQNAEAKLSSIILIYQLEDEKC